MTDQALLAILPQLRAIVVAGQAAFDTILTGDPLAMPARATTASAMFLLEANKQLLLALPAESGAVAADVHGEFDKLLAKIDAVAKPPA